MDLVAECEAGWPLVAHLWNILWALTTAVAEAAVAAPASGSASGAALSGSFDYMGYAWGRWDRYLEEKGSAGWVRD